MVSKIVPPIFVVTSGEVLVFRDVRVAETYMEPIDIANGEYNSAYDGVGRRLRPTVTHKARSFFSPLPSDVSSLNVDEDTIKPLELATILRKFLASVGHDRATLDGDLLEDLVTKTVAAAGFTE